MHYNLFVTGIHSFASIDFESSDSTANSIT